MIGKNYFDPIDEGEDYFYRIDSDQNIKYETLESIYNQIFSKKQTQEAKDISLFIRNKNKYIDKSLTYGEVTFRSMAYIFEYCKSRFDINEEGSFYDLGSGIGCGVLSAALCFNFKKYIGIEFITALNNKANLNKQIFMDKFPELHKQYDEYLPEYIFNTELKNQIVLEIPKEHKKKKKEESEENIDEKEAEKLHEEKLKRYLIDSQNPDHHLNVLDIIYGRDNEEGEGYMSYAKKSKLRNQKFFEEYDRKQKQIQKEEEKERKIERKKMEGSPGFVRRGTVQYLLHGKGSILEQLESKEDLNDKNKPKEEDKKRDSIFDDKDKDKDEEKSDDSNEFQTLKYVVPHIEFICGNFINFDLSQASFIFCNSTCFSNELLLNISRKVSKEVPVGCIVITLTKKLPFLNTNEWDIKKGFKRLMSWGLATIFVHRKTKIGKTTGITSSKKSGSKSGSKTSSSYSSDPSESSEN